LNTPDIKKYFYDNVPGGLAVCLNASEFVFIHSCSFGYLIFDNVPGAQAVCGIASYILFLINLYVIKYLIYEHVHGGLAIWATASEMFLPFQTLTNTFFKHIVWAALHFEQMHQNSLLTTQDVKKYICMTKYLVFEY
jgi:hypothetical protein